MAIYDDQEKLRKMEEGLKGSDFDRASKDFNDITEGTGKNRASPEKLKAAEAKTNDNGPIKDQLGKGYTGAQNSAKKGAFGRLKAAYKGLGKKQKIQAWAGLIGVLTTFATGGFSLMNFLNTFYLDDFMNGVDKSTFMRYQVDMEGRSPAWINAYAKLRVAEIDDPNVAPENRDNLLFRAEDVNTNPVYSWFKKMRKSQKSLTGEYTSKFEQDLLEKYNVKFASVA